MKLLRTFTAALICGVALMAALSARGGSGLKPTQKPSVSQTVKDLQTRAKSGDAVAQNKLGLHYLKGDGVARNDSLAYAWFTRAAAQKYERALVNMAYCLRRGLGTAPDSLKAQALYFNVIARGNDTIIGSLNDASKKDVFLSRTLAQAYNGEKGIKRNPAAVKTYLKQAVDLGDKSALYPYAEICMRTRDHVSAQKAFGAAFKGGDERAGYWYGRYLITGEGGVSDPAEGFRLLYPWAKKENTGAMLLVGKCLLEGNGTTANPTEAVTWLTKASAKGNSEAQWLLALCYAQPNGTDRNFLRAFSLMNRSAMHSSENRFKEWMAPGKSDAAQRYSDYMTFLKGLAAINDSAFSIAQEAAKTLKKNKLDKESKIIEGLALISLNNPKRDAKKGFKLLAPYLDNDPMLLYVVDCLQLQGALNGVDEKSLRNVVADLERLSKSGMGEAYSLLGDIYLDGKCGLEASDQRALANWLEAQKLDGLSFESAKTLARCYEEGLGGLKKDATKAQRLRNAYRADQLQTLFSLIPLR